MDAPASAYDVDGFFRDHDNELVCLHSVEHVEWDEQGLSLRCTTVRIKRRMRERYGTVLETADVVGAGPPATVRIDAVTDHVLRLRVTPGLTVAAHVTPMLVGQPPATSFRYEEQEGSLVLDAGGVSAHVERRPFSLEFRDASGRVLRRTIPAEPYLAPPTGESEIGGIALGDAWPWFFRGLAPLGWVEDARRGERQVFETAFLEHGERLYGLGERFGRLDKRGQAVHLFHANATGTSWPLAYKNVPFLLSSVGYGQFVNSSRPITYHLGDVSHVFHSLHLQDDALDHFIISGPRLADIISRYVRLTGTPAVPPMWSFGLWMSRMSYREQDEIETVAHRLREERIPCDVIHIDTDWFAREWINDLRFSPQRIPEPATMVARLRDQGFRTTLWQLPYISTDSDLYEEGRQHGYFAKRLDSDEPRLIDGFFGQAAVIDFSDPRAAEWYTGHMRPLFEMGIAAIKTDFGEGAPLDARYHDGDPLSMHNLYPLLYTRAVYERTLEMTGHGLVWGRCATAGSQRYPVYWGGDPAARWEDMGSALTGGLGLGLCGFPYWSQDIGAFAGEPSPELYIRWAQVGLFMTHPRAHGAGPREPWAFGPEALRIFRETATLRYRLLPYIYSEARRLAPLGQPVMRALLLDYQDDPTTHDLADEFLLGSELLVAPVLTRSSRRQVFLPPGRWVRWSTGQVYAGPGWHAIEVPLEELPLFLPAGALLALVDPVLHSGEISYEHLTLEVAAGADRASILDVGSGVTRSMRIRDDAERIRLDVDPASAWSVRLRGLEADPACALVDGAKTAWRRAADGAIEVEVTGTTLEVRR